MLARESPIEECAMDALIHNLEGSNLAHLDKWSLGRCHEAILRVVINKYTNLVAWLHIELREAVRKQYLATLAIAKIEAII
jgi:hypothetical protein